uniref:Uncharacterized protein n=1 Tax=Panagrolaimus superbus TaxID=310955 RepID=A0A914YKR3_9BILA
MMFQFLKLVKSEDYGIGTFAERIEEYVERFGHEIDEEQIIYSSFGLLSDAEKDVIIDKSNKILAILKPYIDKRFEIGILTDVIDARSDVVNPEDVKKLGIAAIPSTSHSVSLFYHHRLFLTDIMSTLSSPPTKLSEWEKLIDKWIKIIDILVSNEYPCSIEEHIHGQRIIDRITETCFEYLNSLFTKLGKFFTIF